MPRTLVVSVLPALLGLALVGCHPSGVEGPQVTRVPAGFGYDPNSQSSRRVFPHREVARERTWGTFHGGMDHSSITVIEHPGSVTAADVRSARDALAGRWATERYRYGEVRALRVDGRDSLAWFERQPTSRSVTAVVPHEDVTFVVRFYSSEDEWQDDARMLDIVRSFERDPRALERFAVPAAALL